MRTIYAKHLPYATGHLAAVVAEMALAGPPTIRVMKYRDALFALEGSHRLAAAHYLRLTPNIVVEIPDFGEDLDQFWNRAAPDLPRYDFDHIEMLELEVFSFDTAVTA